MTPFTYTNGVPTAGTGCFYGTSLGLDSPLYAVLQGAAAALDPSGAWLPGWRTGVQPCPPYSGQNSTTSAGYGSSWTGVTCQDGAAGVGCTTTSASAVGGVKALIVEGRSLNGTLPITLRELRTVTSLSVANNALTGSIPASWCARFAALHAAACLP